MFTDSGVKVSVAPASAGIEKTWGSGIGYGSDTPLPVTTKFRTRITTPKGAIKDTWI